MSAKAPRFDSLANCLQIRDTAVHSPGAGGGVLLWQDQLFAESGPSPAILIVNGLDQELTVAILGTIPGRPDMAAPVAQPFVVPARTNKWIHAGDSPIFTAAIPQFGLQLSCTVVPTEGGVNSYLVTYAETRRS